MSPRGYRVEMIPGVTSFCAAAARLGRPLTGGMEEPLCIVPAAPGSDLLRAPGTKAFLKSGRDLPRLLEDLAQAGLLSRSALVARCGLPGRGGLSGPLPRPAAGGPGLLYDGAGKGGRGMIRFVGAGPARRTCSRCAARSCSRARDCVIYAGSLVNPALLGLTKPGCALFNSAEMTLEQVIAQMEAQEALHHETVRLAHRRPEPLRRDPRADGRAGCARDSL